MFNKLKRFSKAVRNSNQFNTVSTISNQCELEESDDPVELMKHKKNYVYDCIQLIANYTASLPVHLYSKTDKVEYYEAKQTDDNTFEILDHPALEFIKNPTPTMNWHDFINICTSYLGLIGNSYWEIIQRDDNLVQLNPYYSEYMSVETKNGEIIYTYMPVNGLRKYATWENTLHIRNLTGSNLLTGYGNLQACLTSSMLLYHYDKFEINLANNYGIPAGILSVDVSRAPTQDAAEAYAKEIKRKAGGRNAGSTLVLTSDATYTPMSNLKDINFDVGRLWAQKQICGAFSVPIDMVDSTHGNRATSTQAINNFKQVTCLPHLKKILFALNQQVIQPTYGENLYLGVDPKEIIEDDQKLQSEVLKIYVESGILTKNEARAIIGYQPSEEAEEDNSEEDNINEE